MWQNALVKPSVPDTFLLLFSRLLIIDYIHLIDIHMNKEYLFYIGWVW